jgi:S-adenosylmethionine decarboxylase proenzyme
MSVERSTPLRAATSVRAGIPVGHHLVAEYFGCDPILLDTAASLESVLVSAAEVSGSHVLGSLVREFQPHGVTCMLVLAESHLSIHTWPECRYAAVDFFSCGSTPPSGVLDVLGTGLGASSVSHLRLIRGSNLRVSLPS